MHKPEIVCFAGPNGSGKSTITSVIRPLTHGKYINADEIMRATFCDAMVAAKEQGYFIRCVFVLTCSPEINKVRVKNRVLNGGHDVPEDKIVSRYYKSLGMITSLIPICDRISIYNHQAV